MRTTGQRTNVHGATQAAEEWRRILDLTWRHGLAALPAARPEFAIVASPGPDASPTVGDLARVARQALDAADSGVLYIDGAQQPEADDVLLVDANGVPQFSCSSWSNLAMAARHGQAAALVISHHAPRSPELTIAFAGTLVSLRRDEVDREWFESVAMAIESVSIEAPAGHPRRHVLSAADYLRYSAVVADGADDPAS